MTELEADGLGPNKRAATIIAQRARELGFHAVGFARANEPLTTDYERYLDYLAQGRQGEMSYLAERPAIRRQVDCSEIVAGAQTVVSLACRYDRPAPADLSQASLTGTIARYARGRDYHGFLRKRLGKLATWVETLGAGVKARAFCDTAPVLEQAWAVRAGLGFVGKNGLLILPGQGSWSLLGEVITTIAVEAEDYGTPIAERCGSCTACLEACPTDAFAAPFVIDPRRCLSYATIECTSGPSQGMSQGMVAGMGEHLFGCDDCQTVCPHNAVVALPKDATAPFRPLARWETLRLSDLVQLDQEAWRQVAQGSPVKRAGRAGLARNALLVAANRLRHGDESARQVLEIGTQHDDPQVAGLAREALVAEGQNGPLY
jgi:epoxyqueuosine reductase